MTNILITGISGFVGSHLASYLKKELDNSIVGIVRDQIPSMWLDEVLDDVILVQGDIRNYDMVSRIINHYDIDQIYHIAAFANVKQAHKFPIHVYESNVMGTVNVLEAVRKVGNGGNGNGVRILILNTDKCYGEKMGAVETDPYVESEPYATSKVCQGFIAKSYGKTYGMDIKMAHSVNIYGYDPFNSRIVSNVVKSCIRGERPIVWTNDNSVREYVYIDDVIDALTKIMNDDNEAQWHDIYNIHTGYIYNQKDIVEMIGREFGIECLYEEGNVPFQIQKETLDSVNWTWKPGYSFEEGIKETIEKFEEYDDDWNRKEKIEKEK